MRGNIKILLFWIALVLVLDIYSFQGVRTLTENFNPITKRIIYTVFWMITAFSFYVIFTFAYGHPEEWSRAWRTFVFAFTMINIFTKLIFVVFLFIDDIIRGIRWIILKFSTPTVEAPGTGGVSRLDFLLKAGLVFAAIPAIGFTYGIINGAHDYTVRRQRVGLKNLPPSFDGFRIVQVSDIHAGSFYNKTAVKRGVQMALDQKPDVIFFTGDLVNNEAGEMKDYKEVFAQLKAPLGVYSVLGNHDYGDYVAWPSASAKHENLEKLKSIHNEMGWQLLMNEHKVLEKDGEKIAVLGIENWGAKGRFPKYGKMSEAHKGTEPYPVKLLLSHDPSHWDAEIRQKYKDIDIMFAGHTHGMQFGIDNKVLKWSPVQYMYEQWSGLYQEQNQYLYVNRGFGYIGYPGRIGITPEITVIELYKA